RWWEKNFHEYVETAEVSEAAVANEYQAAIAESFRDNIDTNEHFYDPSFEQCGRLWLPSLRHDTAETRQGDYMHALFTSEMHTNTPCPSPGIYLVPKTPIQLAAAIDWLTQQGKGEFTENQFVLLPLTVFGQNDKAHRRPQCEENCRIAHMDADWHKYGTNDTRERQTRMLALIVADYNGHAIVISSRALGRIDGGGLDKQFHCPVILQQWFNSHKRVFYTWRRSLLVNLFKNDWRFVWKQKNLMDIRTLYYAVQQHPEQVIQFMGDEKVAIEISMTL
ncbi:MAG: hypothetical protein GY739_19750, partial [Mesoflavibacter sp.]|nr:hypothetical protein [Mesoflavibacter sp.]